MIAIAIMALEDISNSWCPFSLQSSQGQGEGYEGIGKEFLDMENMLVLADDEGIFGSFNEQYSYIEKYKAVG